MLSNLSKVKMKNLLLILSILIISFSVESYSNTDENSTIIAKVGNEEIKYGDLVKAFKKNVNKIIVIFIIVLGFDIEHFIL